MNFFEYFFCAAFPESLDPPGEHSCLITPDRFQKKWNLIALSQIQDESKACCYLTVHMKMFSYLYIYIYENLLAAGTVTKSCVINCLIAGWVYFWKQDWTKNFHSLLIQLIFQRKPPPPQKKIRSPQRYPPYHGHIEIWCF